MLYPPTLVHRFEETPRGGQPFDLAVKTRLRMLTIPFLAAWPCSYVCDLVSGEWVLWQAANEDSSHWVPASLRGDLSWVPSSLGLCHGLPLNAVGIWWLNQKQVHFFFSLLPSRSLSLPFPHLLPFAFLAPSQIKLKKNLKKRNGKKNFSAIF